MSATLIAGGKSNLTYEVNDGDGTSIVWRPPPGHVRASAHDMAKEYRVMAALQATGVPGPRKLGFCEGTQARWVRPSM